MVMSDVSLTVPYEAYLIAETSSAAVETSAVPLAAILSSANTPVGTRQNSIHRVSRILSIRFFIGFSPPVRVGRACSPHLFSVFL